MAQFDSADLLARVKLLSQRPTVDESMPDTSWYALLEAAQAYWTGVFATQVPFVLMSAPTTLTSPDGGFTYTFPNGIYPLAVEIFDATGPARLLRPGPYWDSSADYVWEGGRLRFPQNLGNSGGITPVARYVPPPGVLNASNPPTLQPPHARLLLVYRACAQWARQAGNRDPKPYDELEQKYWIGNPAYGDPGLLGALKGQNAFYGGTGIQLGSGGLLEGVDTGTGYKGIGP